MWKIAVYLRDAIFLEYVNLPFALLETFVTLKSENIFICEIIPLASYEYIERDKIEIRIP